MNLSNMIRFYNRGMALIEIMIGAAIITTAILTIIGSYTIYVQYAMANSGNVQAAYLAEEGIEVMTYFRDKGWSAIIKPLSTTTTYYLTFNGADWATTTIPQVDGSFVRKITLKDVKRDINGKITLSGGTYDSDTKEITVTVDYFQGQGTTTRSVVTYITNLNGD